MTYICPSCDHAVHQESCRASITKDRSPLFKVRTHEGVDLLAIVNEVGLVTHSALLCLTQSSALPHPKKQCPKTLNPKS